jgi:hypothetical protein
MHKLSFLQSELTKLLQNWRSSIYGTNILGQFAVTTFTDMQFVLTVFVEYISASSFTSTEKSS